PTTRNFVLIKASWLWWGISMLLKSPRGFTRHFGNGREVSRPPSQLHQRQKIRFRNTYTSWIARARYKRRCCLEASDPRSEMRIMYPLKYRTLFSAVWQAPASGRISEKIKDIPTALVHCCRLTRRRHCLIAGQTFATRLRARRSTNFG